MAHFVSVPRESQKRDRRASRSVKRETEDDEEKVKNHVKIEELLICPLHPNAANTAGSYHHSTTLISMMKRDIGIFTVKVYKVNPCHAE